MKNFKFVLAIFLVGSFSFSPTLSLAQSEKSFGAAASDMPLAHSPVDQSTATMFHTLFDGPPALAAGPLDPAAYVSFEVQSLSNPGIAYVNWRAVGKVLKRLGFQNPPTHLTPEIENFIFALAGQAMRLNGEDPAAYRAEFRKLYAIRYGGRFLNFNFGDGRGGAGGYVQRKGVGKTPLVRPWANDSHSSGVMGLPEAIHEALWAGIFEEELPLGANPVLFIITTGTKVDPATPDTSDDRAIAIREDMNRPGYYERNLGVFSTLLDPERRDEHLQADQRRMAALIPKLARSLPFPKNLPADATPSEYLHEALNQFIDNVALQYAAAYARQVYHGATSTSNIMIDGRFLDFGTATAVRGFAKVRINQTDGANGETKNIKSDLIFEMLEEYQKELPEHLKSAIPTNDQAGALLDQAFHKHVLEQFLILAGTPQELAPEALATREGSSLAEILLSVAQLGNDKILDRDNGQEEAVTNVYNLGQVLQALTKNQGPRGSLAITTPPPSSMPPAEWAQLNFKWVNYLASLKVIGIKHGIAPITLDRAIALGVRARNTPLDEVMERPSLWANFRQQSKNFCSGKDKFAIQNLIDGTIERSVHEFKTDSYKVEVSNFRDTRDGKVEHRILDLKTGHEEVRRSELPGFSAAREFTKQPERKRVKSALKSVVACARLLFF